jgi:hypothetical protein
MTRDLRAELLKLFDRRVESVAGGLEEVAATIRRQAGRAASIPTEGTPDVATLAASIVHSVMWGLANASVDGIVSAAAEVDRATAPEPLVKPKLDECRCVVSCADDPATMCSLSGTHHVHPDDGSGAFGRCLLHPDSLGDL